MPAPAPADTRYALRAAWSVHDVAEFTPEVAALAMAELPTIAYHRGGHVTDPDLTEWWVDGGWLYAATPATCTTRRPPRGDALGYGVTITSLAREGMGDARIAALLECDVAAVRAVRQQRQVPEGQRGVAVLGRAA